MCWLLSSSITIHHPLTLPSDFIIKKQNAITDNCSLLADCEAMMDGDMFSKILFIVLTGSEKRDSGVTTRLFQLSCSCSDMIL